MISSDHGELLGEYGLYEHPHGVYLEELVEVPWFIIEKGDRPDITEEEPSESGPIEVDDEEIKKNLKDLGYI